MCEEGVTEEGNECYKCEGTGDCLNCEKNLKALSALVLTDDSKGTSRSSDKETA